MRQQIWIRRGSRGVWDEARQAANDDDVSISDLATSALRDYLERRRRRLARTVTVQGAADAE